MVISRQRFDPMVQHCKKAGKVHSDLHQKQSCNILPSTTALSNAATSLNAAGLPPSATAGLPRGHFRQGWVYDFVTGLYFPPRVKIDQGEAWVCKKDSLILFLVYFVVDPETAIPIVSKISTTVATAACTRLHCLVISVHIATYLDFAF